MNSVFFMKINCILLLLFFYSNVTLVATYSLTHTKILFNYIDEFFFFFNLTKSFFVSFHLLLLL
jgi:hypothetical protein